MLCALPFVTPQAQSAIEGLSEEVEHLKRWEGGAVDGTGTKTKESLSEVYQSEELEAAAQLQSRLAESQVNACDLAA